MPWAANFCFGLSGELHNARRSHCEQLIYRCLSTFVPYLFEPADETGALLVSVMIPASTSVHLHHTTSHRKLERRPPQKPGMDQRRDDPARCSHGG